MYEIIRLSWSDTQAKDVLEIIATTVEVLPTTFIGKQIAYGSSAVLPDGVYFFFPDGEWKKLGSEA